LVTGREDVHDGAPEDRHARLADGCQRSDLRGTDRAAWLDDDLALLDVLALPPDVLAGFGHFVNLHDALVGILLGQLDHDHGVRAGRHDASREDPHGLPGLETGLADGNARAKLSDEAN